MTRTCSRCTFANGGRRRRCEMCGESLITPADSNVSANQPNGVASNECVIERKTSSSGSIGRKRSRSSSSQMPSQQSPAATLSSAIVDEPPPAFFFGSARGVSASVSSATLTKANALRDASSDPQVEPAALPVSEGSTFMFATAKGTAFHVSARAIEEAKKKLALLERDGEDERGSASPQQRKQSSGGTDGSKRVFQPPRASLAAPLFSSPSSCATSAIDDRLDGATPLSKFGPLSAEDQSSRQLDPSPSPAAPARRVSIPQSISISEERQSTDARSIAGMAAERRSVGLKTTQALLGEYAAPAASSVSLSRPSFRPPTALEAPRPSLHPAGPAYKAPRVSNEAVTQRPSEGATQTEAKNLVPLRQIAVASDTLSKWEVRCPLRRDAPSIDQVKSGLYEFPSMLCCGEMKHVFSLDDVSVTVRDEHYMKALLQLGAQPSGLKLAWIQEMLKNILWKLLAGDLRRPANELFSLFSPVTALLQLIYRYNREFVSGHRPILRRIAERDTPSNVAMVLLISNIFEERAGPHQVIVEVTDGWYFVRATLDLPLSQLARDGIVGVGQKIVVAGATLCGEQACHPLEMLHSTASLLNVGFNGVKAASVEAPLGALPKHMMITSSIPHIHPNGGPVPCISGVVTRILPPFFLEYSSNTGSRGPSGNSASRGGSTQQRRIVRSRLAESKHCESIENQQAAAYEKLMAASVSTDEAAEKMRDAFHRDVSRVQTLVVEAPSFGTSSSTAQNETAVAIQVITRCGFRGGAVADDDDPDGMPREGQQVLLFNLHPSKMSHAPPPLNIKMLLSRGQLVFRSSASSRTKNGDGDHSSDRFQFTRRIETTLAELSAHSFGQMVDVAVVSISAQVTSDARRTCFVWCLADDKNVFGVLDITSILGIKELAFVYPSKGHVVCIENAIFSSVDETGTYTIVRLQACEFTNISTRYPSGTQVASIMNLITARKQNWKPTLDLGTQLMLSDMEMFTMPGSITASSSVSLMAALATSSTVIAEPACDRNSVARGPYYLNQEAPGAPVASVVKLTQQTISASCSSPRSITRPLFSNASPNPDACSTDAQVHPCASQALSLNACLGPARHLFGNFSMSQNPRLLLTSSQGATRVVSLQDDVIVDTLLEGAKHDAEHLSGKGIVSVTLRVPFFAHTGTLLDVDVPMTVMESIAKSLALTPQQLSALATTDDECMLAASRSQLLVAASQRDSSGPASAEVWRSLFLRSCVIASSTFQALSTDAAGHSMDMESHTLDAWHREKRFRCWNDGLLAASSEVEDHAASTTTAIAEQETLETNSDGLIIWWEHAEWLQLLQEIASSLDHYLVQISLRCDASDEKNPSAPSAKRVTFLKEHCDIRDLIEDSDDEEVEG